MHLSNIERGRGFGPLQQMAHTAAIHPQRCSDGNMVGRLLAHTVAIDPQRYSNGNMLGWSGRYQFSALPKRPFTMRSRCSGPAGCSASGKPESTSSSTSAFFRPALHIVCSEQGKKTIPGMTNWECVPGNWVGGVCVWRQGGGGWGGGGFK